MSEEPATSEDLAKADEKKITHSEERRRIRNEIVSTEETYCEALQLLQALYVSTLEQEKKNAGKYDMQEKTFDILIMNLPTLAPTNQAFLVEIRKTDPLEVATVLNKYADIFKIYTDYTNGFESCMSTIQLLKKNNKKFRPVLEGIEEKLQNEGPKLNLMSYLIMPVQRIPRYVMLLRDLIKASSEGHPQWAKMNSAYTKMEKIATYINESKRKMEAMQKLVEVTDKVKGIPSSLNLVVPHRKLIKDGELTVWMTSGLNQRSSMKICQRHVYLFNDMLMLCKADAVHFKGALTLSSATVEKKDDEPDFSVTTAKSAFGFREEDTEQREAWIVAIENCIKNVKKMRESKRSIQARNKRSLNQRDNSVHNLILGGLSELNPGGVKQLSPRLKKGSPKVKSHSISKSGS